MKTGQMIEKSPGKWLLRVYLGSTVVDGKRKRQYSSKMFEGTTSQATKALTAMQNEVNTKTFVKPSKRTLKDYLQEWLDSKSNIEQKTKLDYQHRLNKDVFPFLGGVQLSQLAPEHIRSLYGKLANDTVRDLSPRTLRYTHTILKAGLSVAVEDGLLQRNPCERKSVLEALPSQKKGQPTILTPDQVVSVIAAEPELQLRALWRFLLLSGVRPQEGLVVKWSDITNCQLFIRRTIGEADKGREFVKEYGKTDGAIRVIELDEDTLNLLQEHRTEQAKAILKAGVKHTRQNYCFSTRTGEHLQRNNVRKYWKRACARIGVEANLYTTRHTHASHYIAATGDVKAAAERLGHSDPAMTLRVYTHSLPGRSKENVKATAGLLVRKAQ